MASHVFLVTQGHFPTCLKYGLYGGVSHRLERINSEVIAGFQAIRPGDFIFFYVKNVGIYGLWRVTTQPFFDRRDIWGDKEQDFPYRVCFEPTIRQFSKPISPSDTLDLRDKGKLWTFDLGTIGKKSHHPITTDEGKELIRLLLRNNPISRPTDRIVEPYVSNGAALPLKLSTDKRGRIKIEGYLNAWLVREFSKGSLKGLIGEYHDFLNFVPTSFNTVMDIFLTHVTKLDSVDILHKFTCIELKTGLSTEKDLHQIIKYENWLTRKLANGDNEMVQSVLIAFDFQDKVLEYVRRRRIIEEKTVRLLTYRVNEKRDDITLAETEFE
jgi:hypothetical protein